MTINTNEFYAVVLGALLHDIGKFVQRAQKNPTSQDHSHWGDEWFQNTLAEKLTSFFDEKEKQIVRSAIANHHDYEKYISLADAISAGMDRIQLDAEEKGDPFTERLISIFSRVSIFGNNKNEKYHRLADLCKEGFDETFPIDEKTCSYEEYKDLLHQFEQELGGIEFKNMPLYSLVDSIYFLLLKYTWCIPSAAYSDEPDIPLFDHLKTTAAIAWCLYLYHQENPDKDLNIRTPSFKLVSGDVSGIQDYIFRVTTYEGKVAKRIRARSLYVQLISEVASHQIIQKFGLPLCNIILSAGGNFYALIPNIANAEEVLKDLQKEFDRWTYEKFRAELFLTLTYIKTDGEKLGEFGGLREDLYRLSHTQKYKPYQFLLTINNKWEKDKFILDEVTPGDEGLCRGCRKHPIINPKEELCEQCSADTQVGRHLPKSKYIAFFKDDVHDFPILNYSFELWETILQNHTSYLVLAINYPAASSGVLRAKTEKPFRGKPRGIYPQALNDPCAISRGVGFKFFANHVALAEFINCKELEHEHDKNPIAFFDCISKVSKGDNLLGYIKADVDNMGKILKYGFDPEKPDGKFKIHHIKPSISRFCSLSRMVETFFAGYLERRLEKDYRDLYTIFSGGDDLFIVGPWNRVIDFSKEIREEFSKFTGSNPDFTFSAGVLLAKHHEPISYCAEMVEDKLKESKRKEGKDKVTLFNQTVNWKELVRILEEANKVIDWLKKEPPIVTRGFLHNLRKYGEMAEQSCIYEPSGEVKTEFLRFIPLLVYDIKRNLTKDEQKVAFNWATELIPSENKPQGGDNLRYLNIIIEYVLTYTRGG